MNTSIYTITAPSFSRYFLLFNRLRFSWKWCLNGIYRRSHPHSHPDLIIIYTAGRKIRLCNRLPYGWWRGDNVFHHPPYSSSNVVCSSFTVEWIECPGHDKLLLLQEGGIHTREKKRKLLLKNGRKDRHDMSVNEHFSLSSWKKTISHLTRERERERGVFVSISDRPVNGLWGFTRGVVSLGGSTILIICEWGRKFDPSSPKSGAADPRLIPFYPPLLSLESR